MVDDDEELSKWKCSLCKRGKWDKLDRWGRISDEYRGLRENYCEKVSYLEEARFSTSYEPRKFPIPAWLHKAGFKVANEVSSVKGVL